MFSFDSTHTLTFQFTGIYFVVSNPLWINSLKHWFLYFFFFDFYMVVINVCSFLMVSFYSSIFIVTSFIPIIIFLLSDWTSAVFWSLKISFPISVLICAYPDAPSGISYVMLLWICTLFSWVVFLWVPLREFSSIEQVHLTW